MTPTHTEIFSNPDWHLLGFDDSAAIFVPMTREHYARSTFLDRRVEAAGLPFRIALDPLLDEAADRNISSCGWIFHIAHCGSTLLARLLDHPNGLVLREPPALRQLGIEAGSMKPSGRWKDRLNLATILSARRYNGAVPTIVKANVPVNFMLAQLADLQPASPMVMLHFHLEAYLIAILQSPQHRAWIDRIVAQLAPSLPVGMLDAPIEIKAAGLWLAQTLRFGDLATDQIKARKLDAERFFANPSGVARRAMTHLAGASANMALNAEYWLGHYSKNPDRPFSEQERRHRAETARPMLDGEITSAKNWLETQGLRSDLADMPSLD